MTSWRDVTGWFDFADLYDEAVAAAPATGARFVELGICNGRSTLYMAEAIRSSGKTIYFYAFDSWFWADGPARMETFRKALNDSGLSEYVLWQRAEFMEAVRVFEPRSLDFVFLDGGHKLEETRDEIRAWLPKVKPGGVFAGHDYSQEWPGVVQAVDELLPGRTLRRNSFWWKVPR